LIGFSNDPISEEDGIHSGVQHLYARPRILDNFFRNLQSMPLLVLDVTLEPADLGLQLGWRPLATS
jgi:hypothetical protein